MIDPKFWMPLVHNFLGNNPEGSDMQRGVQEWILQTLPPLPPPPHTHTCAHTPLSLVLLSRQLHCVALQARDSSETEIVIKQEDSSSAREPSSGAELLQLFFRCLCLQITAASFDIHYADGEIPGQPYSSGTIDPLFQTTQRTLQQVQNTASKNETNTLLM